MKIDYDNLVGKTRKEILEIVKEDHFNDPHSDEWLFYVEKYYFWRKKYLYLLFVDGVVVKSRMIYKNFWEKKY
ncbi:hypothetical protein [Chryseobacterium limigenitum]|uniref:hypothetical protein n=1 Tax=Chryseobacterium limigenitum TaxID=1612149 RepID=UPI00339AFF1D